MALPKNAHALVTGASGGIGLAIAERFAARGYRVTIAARREAVLEQAARSLTTRWPGEVAASVADITIEADRERLLHEARERFGAIDILVNNAGVGYGTALAGLDFERFRRLMEVNYFAVVRLSQMVLPEMIERRRGHIVSIASVSGKVTYPGGVPYCGSKHAVVAFGHALRGEVAKHGIGVSTICPGYVDNDFFAHNQLTGPPAKPRAFFTVVVRSEDVARAVERAISKNRGEIVLPLSMWFVARLYGMAPNFATWLIRKLYKRQYDAPPAVTGNSEATP